MRTEKALNGSSTALVREEFGGSETAQIVETASSAAAAQAQAAVQARYVMALRRPRDFFQVRDRLLKECARPQFAEVARYLKPVGKGVEGPSIRFAEAAIRCMTNVYPETATIYDDATRRIVRVSVTDLEANVTYSKDIVVEKTVERSKVKDGQTVIGERTNSYGKKVYLVQATEDDLLNKEAALASKALRQLALRLLPGDILEGCMVKVIETLENQAAKDPDAERKKLADAFSAIGVSPAQLAEYLGHDLSTLQPAEAVSLRAVYAAIRDGETTWQAELEHKGKGKDAVTAPPKPEVKMEEKPSTAAVEETKPKEQPIATSSPQSPEAELERGFAEAKAPRDLAKLLPAIRALPADRQAHWKAAYTNRSKELSNVA